MEFRQLRYFLAVLKHGSINQAAASLNLTQPSLSHSIRALERSVGAQLLLRSGGGIRLTEIGETFARYAQNILREADKALAEVAAARGSGRGKVAVGVMSGFSVSFIPKVTARFLAAAPGIDVETFTFTSNSDVVVKQLQAAEWDLAITHVGSDFQRPPDIELRRLARTRTHVYCNADHPLARQASVSLEDMAEHPWAVTNIGASERLLNDTFARVGLVPKVRVRTNSLNQVLSFIYAHPSLCLMPEETVAEDLKAGRLVRLDQPFIGSESSTAVLYSNLAERTPAMRTFMRLCAEEAVASESA
jgi:DNA-binding transcriptional LysR family regulator